jgi:hypothetical protein
LEVNWLALSSATLSLQANSDGIASASRIKAKEILRSSMMPIHSAVSALD